MLIFNNLEISKDLYLSSIYCKFIPDDEKYFYGSAFFILKYFSDEYTFYLSIKDQRDFEITRVYETKNKENFNNILNELINFLKDIDGKVIESSRCFIENEFDEKYLFPVISGVESKWGY